MTEATHWSRFLRHRVHRRRALAGGAALIAGAAIYAACDGGGDDAGPIASSPSPGPRRGGSLRTATSVRFTSGLDPQTEHGAGLTIFPRLYGYLLHVDPRDDTLILDHAESVEQPDETTYIFKLRGDVRFHDIEPVSGRAVQARDVVASIRRHQRNPLVTEKPWHDEILDTAEATDDRTVRITTKRPYVWSLHHIGDVNAGAIIPADLIEPLQDITARAAGSGPFVLEAYDGRAARIRRNDAYYAGAPFLDAMEWRIFDDDAARLDAFARREADVTPNRNRDEAESLTDEHGDDVTTARTPSLATVALGLRIDAPPFNDERVREALDLALDRTTILHDLLSGDGQPAGPVNPNLAGGYWALPRRDLERAAGISLTVEGRRSRARRLLGLAGAEEAAFALQVADVPALRDLAGVVASHLRAIGLSVTVEAQQELVWYTNFHRGKFQASLASFPPYESPDIPLRLLHARGAHTGVNPFGYADAETDALIEETWRETDRERRRGGVLAVQRRAIEARPAIYLVTGAGYSTAWSYVRDRAAELPGSLPQYHYRQWLDE
ncbi:MAG TPA: ABC transporter substrate-binding protein [Dehalococcoidia bacterium]|nr:ABC transporter substrate-binding protein [Dehalococcoidia bacterium]